MLRKRALAGEIQMFPGVVRRTLNYGDRMLLAEIVFDEGGEIPWHAHPHEQIGYLAAGRLVFELGDEKRELAAGDSWLVPADFRHKVKAVEPSVAIDVFSPVRDDYRY
ncbi:MAG: cupin domain-containing protein [Dehalococcoidia bacterium]|nr:cupin domain-containing protein [Dehalococcoidia bacterium]